MATEIDLTVGVNLEIGSVPISLEAEISTSPDASIYSFNGSIQEYEIELSEFLGHVGNQFDVDVQLPPELDLKAKIDYIAGQITYTKSKSENSTTTELGAAARFELSIDDSAPLVLQFYAATVKSATTPGTGDPYVIGAAIDNELKFADLPLIGRIPGINELALTNIGFSYTNAEAPSGGLPFQIPKVDPSDNPLYTRSDSNSAESRNYRISSKGNEGTFKLNKKGFALTVVFKNVSSQATLDSFALPMAMPEKPESKEPRQPPFATGRSSPSEGPVKWIDVNRTFGPVDLKKIGLNYAGGLASFGFTAGFSLAGFSLDLVGLTISFPMPIRDQPAGKGGGFDLQGLGLAYKKDNLELSGAFLKVSQDKGPDAYYGLALIKFAKFGLKALGGYAPGHGDVPASFFLYANLQAPLGGPPFLFVTGLAAGFGINNSLKLPTIDELSGFILLPNNAPKQAGSPTDTILRVLPQLESVFENEPGEYWLAAGIQFSSFEMIDAFALVTVSFGVDFKVAVLGSAAMTFPKGSPVPVAYVEVDLLASFTPSTGLLAVEAKLSPASFLYGGFCRLTGGFAFYAWFSGENEGQFVVTLGGYHPAFDPPKYYPTVPRLGMSFGLGPFQVIGQAYFALTPSMMMAGVRLTATWSSGPIKAWFDAGVDFLIAWAPFHYQAEAFVSIGCSADLGLFT
ncbi:MAG: hypothetical protein KDM63_14675, partial [Verrucomicrobiae bacterium]|nr:hypothetical protein [Verrucomicrobiae bacterium]